LTATFKMAMWSIGDQIASAQFCRSLIDSVLGFDLLSA
jgi:hypothetical protein